MALYPDDNLTLVNKNAAEKLFPEDRSELSFIFESKQGSLITKTALLELAEFEKAVFET